MARETKAGRAATLQRRLAAPDGAVMIVAHRGCWKTTSENSLDAIATCADVGIDMVELDVRATRDGMLVLLHDPTVDRMTEGRGKLADLDWAQVRELHLRAGQGRDTALTQRRIPTFEAALRAAKGRILINVDAKSTLSAQVLDLVDRVSDRHEILFKAEAPVADIQSQAPWVQTVRFMPIIREPGMKVDPAASIRAYDPLHPVGYEIDVKTPNFAPIVTPIIRARCARYWVDTLSGRAFDDRVAITTPDAVWGRLVSIGVDAIQTDEPIALKAYLATKHLRSRRCTR